MSSIRCTARRSKATCLKNAVDICEWDDVTNKCKFKAKATTTAPAPVKKEDAPSKPPAQRLNENSISKPTGKKIKPVVNTLSSKPEVTKKDTTNNRPVVIINPVVNKLPSKPTGKKNATNNRPLVVTKPVVNILSTKPEVTKKDTNSRPANSKRDKKGTPGDFFDTLRNAPLDMSLHDMYVYEDMFKATRVFYNGKIHTIGTHGIMVYKSPDVASSVREGLQEEEYGMYAPKPQQQVSVELANEKRDQLARVFGFKNYIGRTGPTPSAVLSGSYESPEVFLKRERGLDVFTPTSIQDLNHGGIDRDNEIIDYIVNRKGYVELNVSLAYFAKYSEAIPPNVHSFAIKLSKRFREINDTPGKYPGAFVVYHCSRAAMHMSDEFKLTTFIPTTRSIAAALKLGDISRYDLRQQRDGSFPDRLTNQGYVYVLRVPGGFPFMNLANAQIIFPLHSTVKISKTIVYGTLTYVYCDVEPYPTSHFNMISQLLESQYQDNVFKYKVKFAGGGHQLLFEASQIKQVTGKTYSLASSRFFRAKVNTVPYILKLLVPYNPRIAVLKSDNQMFLRILNELLASRIYDEVYGLKTIEFQLLDATQCGNAFAKHDLDGRFMFASKEMKIKYPSLSTARSKQFAQNALQGFLVDCIMSNMDIFNNENIGLMTEDKGNERVIRTDVGGSLAYRSRGDEKHQFNNETTPDDFKIICGQESFGLFVKASRLTNLEIRNLVKEYTNSVSYEDIRSKFKTLLKNFKAFLNQLEDEDTASRYISFTNSIVQKVKRRHKWYTSNLDTVLDYAFPIKQSK